MKWKLNRDTELELLAKVSKSEKKLKSEKKGANVSLKTVVLNVVTNLHQDI